MASQFKKLFKGFGYATNGLKRGLQERNMKIHLSVALTVISLSILFRISTIEWLIVLTMFGLVITTEMVNTSIEDLSDLLNEKLKLDFHHTTAPRDLAAAAVLVSATISALVGLIIFLPKIILLF